MQMQQKGTGTISQPCKNNNNNNKNYAKKLQHYIYAANKSVLLLMYERSMQTNAEVVTMTQ